MSSFKTNPWDVDQLLSLMDKGKLVLPEFQRSFVWWPSDIDLLLTSLIQDFPAGSLLFLRADGTSDLAWRLAEGIKQNGAPSPDYLVLDGQQRLTSLSLALNGRGDHLFFLDLNLVDQEDVENGVYPLRRKDAEKKQLLDRTVQFDRHTYPLWAAMGEHKDDWWFQEYAMHHAQQGGDLDELKDRAKRLQETFVKPLTTYRFPVVELPADTSLEAVCQIFETLNKTGMKLTVFDLLTARFWPQGINLRELLDQAREEYPLLGSEEFDVESTYLLQAVSLVRNGVCKRGDLLKLDVTNFEEDWWRVVRAASTALAVLRSECGVLIREWVPYAALFPSLFAVATRVLQLAGPAQGAAWEKLNRWFWCSSFGNRYDGPPNTLNATDLTQLTEWITNDEQVPEAVSGFAINTLDLRRVERPRAAVYRAVICLTIVNGARDFHTGNQLTADRLKDPANRIEDHHLVPTGWLKKQEPPHGAANTILNRSLIDHATNRRISDRSPATYLAEIEQQLGHDKLEEVLASHLIPYTGHGGLGSDDLEAFLSAREHLLIGAIAGVTGATVPEAPGETYLDPTRPFTNELALRKVLRALRGNVLWYEQHMSAKALELLVEEINTDAVIHLRLLSGPANLNERAKRRFESFKTELGEHDTPVEWRVMSADAAREIHARVIFDTDAAWELPPLNSLLKGTVDSIRTSDMPRDPFEQAWGDESAIPLEQLTLPSPAT